MNKEVMILIDLQTLLFELESKFPFLRKLSYKRRIFSQLHVVDYTRRLMLSMVSWQFNILFTLLKK